MIGDWLESVSALSTAIMLSSSRSVSLPSDKLLVSRKSDWMYWRFSETRLAQWSRPALVSLTFGSLILVGLVDYWVGYELSVLIFYLLPVSLAAWYVSRRFAVLISCLSVVVWIAGDVGAGATYANKIVFAWNATIVLGFLLVVAFLLDSLRASFLELESRVRQRTVALTEEITERYRLEKEVLEVSEREQRRIGHDLHDSLGQHLTATAMAGQVLSNDLAGRHLHEAAGKVERVVGMIEASIELTRNLARGLSPATIETEGLAGALIELASNTTEQLSVLCEFHGDSLMPYLDSAAAMHLYRIAQEAISNAVRHGSARRVDITCEPQDAERLTLTIQDNGSGLPPADRRREGLGLRIMAHRAKIIDAELEVSASPAGGTTVRCVFNAAREHPLPLNNP